MNAALTTTFVCFISCLLPGQENDRIVRRLMEEAPQGWSRIDSRNQIGTMEMTLHRWALLEGKRIDIRQYRFRNISDLNSARLELKRIDLRQKELIPTSRTYLANESYGAMITSKEGDAAAQVSWIGKNSEAAEAIPKDTYFRIGANATHHLWSQPLAEIFAHPKFRIIDAKEQRSGELDIVSVRFECITEDPAFQFRNATVSFCPNLDWAIVDASYRISPEHKYENRVRNAYVTDAPGTYRRIESDVYTYAFDGQTEDHFDYEIVSMDHTKPSARKFYLRDFGLPEPVRNRESSKTSNLHLFLFAIAIGLFGIAFGLNRAARRTA